VKARATQPLAIVLVCVSLLGCAANEGARDPDAFQAPAPLKPKAIDGTPEKVKAAWMRDPVSAQSVDRELGTELATARAERSKLQGDADTALENSSRRGKRRRNAQREHTGKLSRTVALDLDTLAREGAKALDDQTRKQKEGTTLQVEVARAEALLTTTGANETQLLNALRAQREQTGARAREAEAKAAKVRRYALTQRRFLETTLRQGLVVPAARLDARNAELRAQHADQTALRVGWLHRCAQIADSNERSIVDYWPSKRD
jgi:hypothetical protein